jgi:biopolymer transport protein ExbD
MLKERLFSNSNRRGSGNQAWGLRTRYMPRSRINPELVAMAPWLSLVLLVLMFLMLDYRQIIQPGMVIELPQAPFSGGTFNRMAMVIKTEPSASGASWVERIFFEDSPFLSSNDEHMSRLAIILRSAAARQPGDSLVIFADARVTQGTMMRICQIAEKAGIRTINFATDDRAAAAEAQSRER